MINIVIFGLPGSGKDVQSQLLAKQYGLVVISPGEIFREAIKAQTPLGKKIEQTISSGGLLPDSTVAEVVQQKIDQHNETTNFVFNGYPRSLGQARMLKQQQAVKENQIDICLYLEVNPEDAIERLKGRKVIAKRIDDDDDVVRRRILSYKSYSAAILEFYAKEQKLVRIDGTGNIEMVNSAIKQAIEAYAKQKAK